VGNEFIQVLAVGKNELQTTNSIHGFRTKPRTGSSSAPVTNCKTEPKEIPSLLWGWKNSGYIFCQVYIKNGLM
jgi:hypothetical protein